MTRKLIFTTLALTFSLLVFGCQAESPADPASEVPPPQENIPGETPMETEIQPVTVDEIANITWQWVALIENNPAAQSVVPDPENYTITFGEDGTVSLQIDCNSGGGTYTVEGSSLEFGPIMTTLMMCEAGSLDVTYTTFLSQVGSFGLRDGQLVLVLKDDAGEMHFEHAGLADQEPAPEEKTLYIGPEKVECVGVAPMECYQVKETPESEWQLFYSEIEGFTWEPGYTYELRVAVHTVENPPADGSSLRYELIEVVDKVETPVKPAQYITIEQPAEDAVLDASQPILVSGMGAGLFEGNVVVQILDAAGEELALQPTILQSPEAGMGGEGPWQVELIVSVEAATPGKIVAFSDSPADGSIIAQDQVSVSLNPAMFPKVDLENTPWLLNAFDAPEHENLNPLLDFYPVTVFFDPAAEQITGNAGCNNYFGNYTLDDKNLALGPVGSTRMMCPEPQMQLETAFLAALEKVASYGMGCNAINLLDADGNTLLVLRVDPFSQSESFTREDLANAAYLSEFTENGVVQLTNGEYRAPVVEGAAAELVVMLTNFAAFGDLDGDGTEDAAVILVTQFGGSGSFYDLAILRKQDAALTNIATVLLGDRVQINGLGIENGEIAVDLLTQGPDDPMCCPTLQVVNRYILQNGELLQTSSDEVP